MLTNSKQPSSKFLLSRIDQLSHVKICCVDIILSKFIDSRSKRDVTLNPTGSICLFNAENATIYITPIKNNMYHMEEVLAFEINRFLGNHIHNLLYLEAVLKCTPE